MNINLVSTNKIINFAVDNLTLIIRESITPMRRLVLGFDQPPYSILGILLGCPFNFYWLPLWLPWTYYLKISFWKTHHIFIKLLYADGWSNYIYAVPARTIWRRPLMVRQPYSVAVPSTGGRLHPLVPEVSVPYKGNRRGRKDYWREAWWEMWSLLLW